MDGVLQALARGDARARATALGELLDDLQSDRPRLDVRPHLHALVPALAACTVDSALKVASGALEAVAALAEALGDAVTPLLEGAGGGLLERLAEALGNAKPAAREKACDAVQALLNACGPQQVVGPLVARHLYPATAVAGSSSGGGGSSGSSGGKGGLPGLAKNWRVREGILSLYTAQALAFGAGGGDAGDERACAAAEALLPKACDCLSDAQPEVRKAAADALAALAYLWGGASGLTRVTQRIAERGARPPQVQAVRDRFEVTFAGLEPAAGGGGGGAGAEAEPPRRPPTAGGASSGGASSRPPASAAVPSSRPSTAASTAPPPLNTASAAAASSSGFGSQPNTPGGASPAATPSSGTTFSRSGGFTPRGGPAGIAPALDEVAADADVASLRWWHASPLWRPGVLGGSLADEAGKALPATPGRETLAKAIDGICSVCATGNSEWKLRSTALEKLRGLIASGALLGGEGAAGQVARLRDALTSQAQDLRSTIVKQACLVIAELSAAVAETLVAANHGGVPHTPGAPTPRGLPGGAPAVVPPVCQAWEVIVDSFVEVLMKQTVVTIAVIAQSAQDCIRSILHNSRYGHPRVLQRLCSVARTSRSPVLRGQLAQWLLIAVRGWATPCLDRYAEELAAAIGSLVQDADPSARAAGRLAFWSFSAHFPARGEALLATLDPAAYRNTLDDREAAEDDAITAACTPVVPVACGDGVVAAAAPPPPPAAASGGGRPSLGGTSTGSASSGAARRPASAAAAPAAPSNGSGMPPRPRAPSGASEEDDGDRIYDVSGRSGAGGGAPPPPPQAQSGGLPPRPATAAAAVPVRAPAPAPVPVPAPAPAPAPAFSAYVEEGEEDEDDRYGSYAGKQHPEALLPPADDEGADDNGDVPDWGALPLADWVAAALDSFSGLSAANVASIGRVREACHDLLAALVETGAADARSVGRAYGRRLPAPLLERLSPDWADAAEAAAYLMDPPERAATGAALQTPIVFDALAPDAIGEVVDLLVNPPPAPSSSSSLPPLAALLSRLLGSSIDDVQLEGLALLFVLVDAAADLGGDGLETLPDTLPSVAEASFGAALAAGDPIDDWPVLRVATVPVTLPALYSDDGQLEEPESTVQVTCFPVFGRALHDGARGAFNAWFSHVIALSTVPLEAQKLAARRCLAALRRSFAVPALLGATATALAAPYPPPPAFATAAASYRTHAACAMLSLSLLGDPGGLPWMLESRRSGGGGPPVRPFLASVAELLLDAKAIEASGSGSSSSSSPAGSFLPLARLSSYIDQLVTVLYKSSPGVVAEALKSVKGGGAKPAAVKALLDALANGALGPVVASLEAPMPAPAPAPAPVPAPAPAPVPAPAPAPAPAPRPATAAAVTTAPPAAPLPTADLRAAVFVVPLTRAHLELVLTNLTGTDEARRLRALHYFGRAVDAQHQHAQAVAGGGLAPGGEPPAPAVTIAPLHRDDPLWMSLFDRILTAVLALAGGSPDASGLGGSAGGGGGGDAVSTQTALSVLRKLFRNAPGYVAGKAGTVFAGVLGSLRAASSRGSAGGAAAVPPVSPSTSSQYAAAGYVPPSRESAAVIERTVQECAGRLAPEIALTHLISCLHESVQVMSAGSSSSSGGNVAFAPVVVASLRCLSATLARCPEALVLDALSRGRLMDAVSAAFASAFTDVRRATVALLVDVHLAVGPAAFEALAHPYLTVPQQKLLGIYVEKAAAAAAAAGGGDSRPTTSPLH